MPTVPHGSHFKRFLTGLVVAAIVAVPHGSPADEDPTASLLRQTRELFDAVSAGDRAPWQRYVDPRASYLDEDGTLLSKADLVSQIKPLPPGVSGTIEVTDFRVHVH